MEAPHISQLMEVVDLLYTVLMLSHLKPPHPVLRRTLLGASPQIERSSRKSDKNYQDGFRIDLDGNIRSTKCGSVVIKVGMR